MMYMAMSRWLSTLSCMSNATGLISNHSIKRFCAPLGNNWRAPCALIYYASAWQVHTTLFHALSAQLSSQVDRETFITYVESLLIYTFYHSVDILHLQSKFAYFFVIKIQAKHTFYSYLLETWSLSLFTWPHHISIYVLRAILKQFWSFSF